jgi:hypothetical protein
MNKGWLGGNRIRSKKASHDDRLSLLCRQEDSQAHWLHHYPHPPSSLLRAGAFSDLTDHIAAYANPSYGKAFRTVLQTTAEPEKIWTGNWSWSKIHHFTSLLATAQVLPSTPGGLSALSAKVLQLSRFLSRTALKLWIVKTYRNTHTTPTQNRRRRHGRCHCPTSPCSQG